MRYFLLTSALVGGLVLGCSRQADDHEDWEERAEVACSGYCERFFGCPSPNVDFFDSEVECYDTCTQNYFERSMQCPGKALRVSECMSVLSCEDFVFSQDDLYAEGSPCQELKLAWSACAAD